MPVMPLPANLDQLSADELRQLVIRQAGLLAESDRELNWRQGKIDKLTHELAVHKRWRFGVKTEHWPVEQRQLFEEAIDADLAAMEEELAHFSLKRLEPMQLGWTQSTILFAPVVERGIRDAHLPADLFHRRSDFCLLQGEGNLFIRKFRLLHGTTSYLS